MAHMAKRLLGETLTHQYFLYYCSTGIAKVKSYSKLLGKDVEESVRDLYREYIQYEPIDDILKNEV